MKGLLGSKSFPPGFRFHPTDEELVLFYLKRKVLGKSLGPEMISEVDVYRFSPWDLPEMACLKTRDLNWYFFCPRAKKYPNGGRTNRATERGYWKSTGTDRTVMYASRTVGMIKTLVYHIGKAPKGERTDWVMHEYRLEDRMLTEKGVPQDSYVICKIFEKSGLGPKNGESYGAPFVEEEWDSDNDDSGLVMHGTGCGRVVGSSDGSVSVVTSSVGAPNVASLADTPFAVAAATNVASPGTTVASVGTPYMTAASVGTKYVSVTSVGMPNITPVSIGMPSVAAASVDSANAIPTSEDELDRLLKHFSDFTENVEDVGDIYNGLGDLADPSPQNTNWGDLADSSVQNTNWGDLADPSVQNTDWGDSFIEINDLK